eukprot:TRINITY_DN65277_c0_g1_i1.p1 TRINITY_DN65277_c0_g1~~TRINITY_DN65277_c0_g1_i1.p1  ORF type:complete len:1032 (-),score=194.23 TRINITY_DN65277_c0_g1_i1:262-3114(-)
MSEGELPELPDLRLPGAVEEGDDVPAPPDVSDPDASTQDHRERRELDRLLERPVKIQEELEAKFEQVEREEGEDDNFNDLGRRFPRDNSNRVNSVEEVIGRVNDYSYTAPASAKVCFYITTCMTGGSYYIAKRRTIPAGFFGHYESAGRNMLTLPGQHALCSTVDTWLDDEPIDDTENLIRVFGVKTLIVVPENHVAGAFRVGSGGAVGSDEEDANNNDGEFVLLGQGRHVLDSSSYRDIVIQKLEGQMVTIGPVTVLYIKEGYLGGAYERNTGIFRVLQPGPPYLLHEKDYEGIVAVQRTLTMFRLGPISFVTVKEGEMAGAYNKSTGLYQLLAPGHTYQLHEKDYEGISLVERQMIFELGPITFITVQKGYIAGAYKKLGGEFVVLPPGNSYQLNKNEFEKPELVKRNKHVVNCGPLTFVTLQEGVLTGAYRTRDGRFQEFTEDESCSEFILHERDYHGLTVVEKYSPDVQDFGPNKIVTIPEGFCGVFEREGAIEIKEAGFYKVSAEYRIRPDNIPLQINSERFENLSVQTKDSVLMTVAFVVVWRIADALAVAKWPGDLAELTESLRTKATSSMVMLLRAFTRSQLLPTRQDVQLHKTAAADDDEVDEEGMEEAVDKAARMSKELLQSTETNCLEMLNSASEDGAWGLTMVSLKIDTLEIADHKIMMDLQMLAQSQLAKQRKQMESRLEIQNVKVEREAKLQQANAEADVARAKAESDAAVELANARAENEVRLQKAKAEAEVLRTNAESNAAVELAKAQAQNEVALAKASMEAKAEAELKQRKAESDAAVEIANARKHKEVNLMKAEGKQVELQMQRDLAESQAAIEETNLRVRQREAEVEAARVRALAEAQYEKGCKEQEVLSMMPPQELELRKLDKIVEGLKAYGEALGHAAWRHPDEMFNFMEELKPYLRIQSAGLSAEQLATSAAASAAKSSRKDDAGHFV